MWAQGDYREIARWLVPAAEELVVAAGVEAGDRALDVAAGAGNVAVALAACGARVTALDLEPHLVAHGRERTEALDVEWVVGDALALPFEDGSFDAALSAFGVMYVPDAVRGVAELCRVVRTGGTVAVASWTPQGFQGRCFAAMRALVPPQSRHRPEDWGDEKVIAPILHACLRRLRLERRALRGKLFADVEEWWAHADRNAPPLVALRSSVGKSTYDQVRDVLLAVAREFAVPVEGEVAIEQEYLLAIGTVR